MTDKTNLVLERLGYFMLLMAAIFLLLFLANLRSRFYYRGPNYSFIFWLFAWAGIAGMGLLRLRKWAVTLLFLPGVLSAVVICVSIVKAPNLSLLVIFVNILWATFMLGVPLPLFRYWADLRW